MIKFIIVLIIIIIIGLIGIYHQVIYNRLNTNKIKIDEAREIINDNLKKRYDYVVRTSHLIKKNLDLDIEQFKEIETLKVKEANEDILDEKLQDAFKIMIQLKEDYPQLTENRGFQEIIKDYEESNELLEATKSFYDKYAERLNSNLSTFPYNLVGKIHGIKKIRLYNIKSLAFNNEIMDSK